MNTDASPFPNSSGDVKNMFDYIKQDYGHVWRDMHARHIVTALCDHGPGDWWVSGRVVLIIIDQLDQCSRHRC